MSRAPRALAPLSALGLSGFDSQWADGDTRRRISYTNLRPGDYQFEVNASNHDGVWNDRGAHWDFSVAPFVYQTRWFYGLCALLVAAIGGACTPCASATCDSGTPCSWSGRYCRR